MENIFFIALVAVVGLLRWLSKVAEEKRNSEVAKRETSPTPNAPAATSAHTAPGSEEERVRKFLEALGVPASQTPPPKARPRQFTPRTAPASREILPVDPFPLPRSQRAEPAPPIATAPPPLPPAPPEIAEIPPVTPAQTIVPPPLDRPLLSPAFGEFEVQEWSGRVSQEANAAGATLAARLANAEGLRDAIVLREIFGPPRGLQPLERIIGS